MKKALFLLPLVVSFVLPVFAQHGGKAEANRVKFPRGRSSTTLIGTLSNDEQMEFVFTARKGQRATVRNSSNAQFEVSLFSEELGIDNTWNSAASFTLGLPAAGDYLLFVRKKPNGKATAKFSVTLSLR